MIADHIRATAFLVSDGVIPGSEGRGYVQRRIIRRAIRHGYKLVGQKTPFFHKLVADLVAPDGRCLSQVAIRAQEQRITEVLKNMAEEEPLRDAGQWDGFVLDAALGVSLRHAVVHWSGLVLPGDVAFKLHDTYGFPLDLTNDVCRERGVEVDEAGFRTAMESKAQARAAGKFKMDKALDYTGAINQFTGYETLADTAKIIAIYIDGTSAAALKAGQNGVVVLDTTPLRRKRRSGRG